MNRRNFAGQLAATATAALGLATAQPAAAQAQRRPAAPGPLAMTVEAVQMPAWVERGGERLPFAPGDAVSTADEVQTGPGAGLVLRMPEGSLVRLGEKTRLGVQWMDARQQDGRVRVQSELKLFDGFFRFATSAVAKAVGERRVDVALRTATIGIRGTDFWSMTDEEHDAACLFEGKVDLATRDQGNLSLEQPTAFWARFFQRPVQPVGNATPQQLATFLNSTEVTPGRGIAVAQGAWRVIAATGSEARAAMRLGGRLRAEGYSARVVTLRGEYVVQIAQLASEADARAVLARIAGIDGVQGRVTSGG